MRASIYREEVFAGRRLLTTPAAVVSIPDAIALASVAAERALEVAAVTAGVTSELAALVVERSLESEVLVAIDEVVVAGGSAVVELVMDVNGVDTAGGMTSDKVRFGMVKLLMLLFAKSVLKPLR